MTSNKGQGSLKTDRRLYRYYANVIIKIYVKQICEINILLYYWILPKRAMGKYASEIPGDDKIF